MKWNGRRLRQPWRAMAAILGIGLVLLVLSCGSGSGAKEAAGVGGSGSGLARVPAPTIDPGGGTYGLPPTLSLATSVAGAVIHYTTDGSPPSPAYGHRFESPFRLNESATLQAMAFKTGMMDSPVISTNYTLLPPVEAPSITPPGGTHAGSVMTVLASATPGAAIRFSLDGSDPLGPTGLDYGSPITLTGSATVRALARKNGLRDSVLIQAAFTLLPAPRAEKPIITPHGGAFAAPVNVSLLSSSPGASLRYTTDGSQPTAEVGHLYQSPFLVATNTLVRAVAFGPGWSISDTASAEFTFLLPTLGPQVLPQGGNYSAPVNVTLAPGTPGSLIRYTLDGTEPRIAGGAAGTLYSGPILLSTTTTLRAVAGGVGRADSPLLVATYAIDIPTHAPYLGMNFRSMNDWERQRPFADVMKTSRAFTNLSGGTPGLDEDGLPTEDARVVVWAGLDRMHGTYRLRFQGQADVAGDFGTIALTSRGYSPATNTTSYDLVVSNSESAGLRLTFTNTKRSATASANTGIREIQLLRPRTPGGSAIYGTELFTDPFKASLAPYSLLRFMIWQGTNGNGISTWSQRTRPGHASQRIGNPTAPSGSWEGRGGAIEYAIQLANEVGKDIWLCVPALADETYVTNLARLCRYGSDGREPYTSPQASPVYPPLRADLNLYLEYSNELWNTAFGFQQSLQNRDLAIAEVNAGGSPLNFDGTTNEWYWAARRSTKRTLEISQIFRTVFGDSAMNTRIRVILASQLGNPGFMLQQFRIAEEHYNNPARVADPRPLNYYVYGAGGSAYYSPDNASDALDLSSIWTSRTFDVAAWKEQLAPDAHYTLGFGLKRIAYEGGPSLDNVGHSEAVKAQAWGDARMTDLVVAHHTAWNQSAGDHLVYFSLVGDYQWGFLPDVLDYPNHPKAAALETLKTLPRDASTFGTPIPATLLGNAQHVPPSWAGGGASYSGHSWNAYSLRVSQARSFQVQLQATASSPDARLDVYLDGQRLGTLTVAPNAPTASLTTPELAVGSHGLRIVAAGGSCMITSIRVE